MPPTPPVPEYDPRPARGRREERTATSKARILDAAVACLVESGYAGATTLRIQARAGVSRGRLLHHFPSRDELLIAAAQHLVRTGLATVAGRQEALSALSGAPRLDAAVDLLWSTFFEPQFWASMELWVAARTNPELRAALLPHERALGAAIRDNIAHHFEPRLRAHPRYPFVRDLLFTSMRGVAMGYAMEHRDPRTEPHLAMWRSLTRLLLEPVPPGQAS